MEKSGSMKINSEYHTIGGENIVEKNPEYAKYREKWYTYPKERKVADFPLFLDIDITDLCNLKCSFCLRQSNPELIQNKKMRLSLFRKIIDEGSRNGLYGCKLSIIGEPLIHEHIFSMIKYAKENGLIDVYFNTNATLLTEDVAHKLVESNLDRLSISFEGYTKDVYERYRIGSNYSKVLNNIKRLQYVKKELGVNHPKVRVQTVLLPELKDSIGEYINFWKPLVDEVGFLDYQPRIEKKKVMQTDWECQQLYQRMGILVDGTIMPCNHDERKLCALGNAKDSSIKDAWHSHKLGLLRLQHKIGASHLVGCCKDCYLRQSEILKEKKK